MSMLHNVLARVLRLPATVFILLIWIYQRTFSFDHGPLRHFFPFGYCIYKPTCSDYALQKLQEENLMYALWLIMKRIASCNPCAHPSKEKIVETLLK